MVQYIGKQFEYIFYIFSNSIDKLSGLSKLENREKCTAFTSTVVWFKNRDLILSLGTLSTTFWGKIADLAFEADFHFKTSFVKVILFRNVSSCVLLYSSYLLSYCPASSLSSTTTC